MAKRIAPRSHSSEQKPSGAYLQALRLYWQGESTAVIAQLADALGDVSLEAAPALYRLWIELLADEGDEASLRLILSHINRQINFKHPSWVPLYALVGLAHYELGELEAAHLVARAMRKHHVNAYYKELALVLHVDIEDAECTLLVRSLVRNSADYFHFRRACLVAHRFGKMKTLGQLFNDTKDVFGTSPLPFEIGFHDAFATKNFKRAWRFARRLRSNFPVQSTYQFYYAYTSYMLNRNQLALREFLQLNRRFAGEDPDVLCMIGATLLSPRETISEQQRVRGSRYLQKASQRLEALGLPSAYPQELMNRLGGVVPMPSNRLWIVKLTPRQNLELQQKSPDQIEYLYRAMGDYVKQGDLCFFVTETRHASEKEVGLWRLSALYRAASNPEWHPIHRWQTALKLQIRLEVSVPIEIEGNQPLPKSQLKGAQRYGLLELDKHALEHIEESIRSFTLDDQVYSQFFDGLRNVVGSL